MDLRSSYERIAYYLLIFDVPWKETEETLKIKNVDLGPYLAWLKDKCVYIDIRGLQVGSGRAHRFEIDRLYIPLTTSSRIKETDEFSSEGIAMEKTTSVPLSDVLKHQYVTIIGDPGSGKTTFLRYIASAFGNAFAENDPGSVKDCTGLENLFFPLFLRVSELAEFILHYKNDKKNYQWANSRKRSWRR